MRNDANQFFVTANFGFEAFHIVLPKLRGTPDPTIVLILHIQIGGRRTQFVITGSLLQRLEGLERPSHGISVENRLAVGVNDHGDIAGIFKAAVLVNPRSVLVRQRIHGGKNFFVIENHDQIRTASNPGQRQAEADHCRNGTIRIPGRPGTNGNDAFQQGGVHEIFRQVRPQGTNGRSPCGKMLFVGVAVAVTF